MAERLPFTLRTYRRLAGAATPFLPLLVSNRLAEPNYDVMLSWDPDSLPSGWEAIRARYFTYNWLRFGATWAAFGLFLAALVAHLR